MLMKILLLLFTCIAAFSYAQKNIWTAFPDDSLNYYTEFKDHTGKTVLTLTDKKVDAR